MTQQLKDEIKTKAISVRFSESAEMNPKNNCSQSFIDDIKEILLNEYSKKEADEMLESALIEEGIDHIKVTYDNGNIDRFKKVIKAVYCEDSKCLVGR